MEAGYEVVFSCPQDTSGYRVFTRRFDKVVLASQLPSTPEVDDAWDIFMSRTLPRRTAWELAGLEHASRVRAATHDTARRDTLVTLLIDHSGSMRGERMLLTAAAIDVARAYLAHLGIAVEVLGFTTRSWKGGWSRWLWRWTGRRRNPGRLCDLLHIVYQEVDRYQPPGTGMRSLKHMLDPHLLKENVDGEAILWAAARQDRHSYQHKAILVVSDGAPVDDSTLHENDEQVLWRHLKQVVVDLQHTRVMAQLQIGSETPLVFPIGTRVQTLPEVGEVLLELLSHLVIRAASDQPIPPLSLQPGA